MSPVPNDRAAPHEALDNLAKEMNLPFADVMNAYETTMAELAAKAKIDTFLHIFAMRNLRDKFSSLRRTRRL